MDVSWIKSGIRMVDLSKIGERERLKAQPGDEPHWQRLRAGCFVGYRSAKRGGRGTWFARAYDPELRKYARKPLGSYGPLEGNHVFTAAKRDAEAWADQVEAGGLHAEKIETVADACRVYLKEMSGKVAEGVFRRHVYSDPIAKVRLDKLRRRHLLDWRKRLEEAPALVSRNKLGEQRTKKRSSSTVNRDMVPVRAALGRVLSPGNPNTEAAWQEALKPQKGVEKRRDLYLDRQQRRVLLTAIEDEARPFVRALCILPLRPGALANLLVCDFEHRTRTLTIGKDEHGRPRQISVPSTIADFLNAQIKGKLPSSPMFCRVMAAHGTRTHGSTRLRRPFVAPSCLRRLQHTPYGIALSRI